jgi:hypothetical protein
MTGKFVKESRPIEVIASDGGTSPTAAEVFPILSGSFGNRCGINIPWRGVRWGEPAGGHPLSAAQPLSSVMPIAGKKNYRHRHSLSFLTYRKGLMFRKATSPIHSNVPPELNDVFFGARLLRSRWSSILNVSWKWDMADSPPMAFIGENWFDARREPTKAILPKYGRDIT